MLACRKNDVNFSVSPDAPRAGESVRFTNLSSSGEEWTWSFGDGSTSTLKSPTHTYKKSGKYLVTLRVDNKPAWTATRELTVFDTVPTFICEDTAFYIYRDYTFRAHLYNPYNYPVSYCWTQPDTPDGDQQPYIAFIDQTQNGSSVQLYFTTPADSVTLCLQVVLNADTTLVRKTFAVRNRATNSLLLRTPEADYRQRIFGKRAEPASIDPSATPLLDAEQDTIQTYNGYTFHLSDLDAIEGILGFHIANRKLYYRADGLWVANIDGSCPVRIDSLPCAAMTLDLTDNRIYWANAEGVWYMPFVGSDNNQFVSVPTLINTSTSVTHLATDPLQQND